jgi:transcription-repair coupling factor (superfamily II helicase)
MATRKDAKEELTTTQHEQQQAVNKALDETKDEIKVATREAAREIPQYQSVWTPFVENANSRFWNYWSISPKEMAETYGTVVSSFADNVIAATRLTNNAVFANMELFSTALQRTKDNSKEFSRLGVNTAKVFHEATNDVANTGFYAAETVPSSRPRR